MHEMDEIDETNEMKNKKNIRGILLVALSAASFGFIPVFAKIAYSSGTSTYTLLFLRFLVATVFMFVFLLVKKLPLPTKKEMLIFFLLGAIGYAGESFCYFTALNYASSSTVALLFYTYPALVMLGSASVFKEKITIKKAPSIAELFICHYAYYSISRHYTSLSFLCCTSAFAFLKINALLIC